MKPEHLSLEHIHKDILVLARDVEKIRMIVEEDDLELSDETKRLLEEARKVPESELISQEEVEKRFLK